MPPQHADALARRSTPGGERWQPCRRLVGALSLLLLAACAPPQDLETPEGALAALVQAYHDKAPARVLELCSPKTDALATEAWRGLTSLKASVARDLPLGPREEVARQAGLQLLTGLRSREELFGRLIGLGQIDVDSGVRYGAAVVERQVDDTAGVATLKTRGGQTFELRRGEDRRWRSQHLEALLEQRLVPLRANLAALEARRLALVERDRKVDELMGRTSPAAPATGAPPEGAAGAAPPVPPAPAAATTATTGEAPAAGAAKAATPPKKKARRPRRRRRR